MRIYLAGPMTNRPHYNYAAFMDAQCQWEARGHKVLSPFDASERVWRRAYNRSYDPFKDSCEYGSDVMLECWLEDTDILLWSEGVALLRGWETSRGSRIEVQTALLFGKKLFCAETFKELNLSVAVSFTPL